MWVLWNNEFGIVIGDDKCSCMYMFGWNWIGHHSFVSTCLVHSIGVLAMRLHLLEKMLCNCYNRLNLGLQPRVIYNIFG